MNKFFSFILYILILFDFSLEFQYELEKIFDEKDFDELTFEYNECNTIPSLSIPIFLAPIRFLEDSNLIRIEGRNSKIKTPILFKPLEEFSGILHINSRDNSIWNVEDNTQHSQNCYFGLSSRLPNTSITGLKDDEINLLILNRSGILENPIFSFDKWNELTNKSISSKLYYGENHDDFISNPGVKATCKLNEKGEYWGCLFDNIYFGDKNISLISNVTGENYNIYFSSEKSEIEFPLSLEEDFLRITNDNCNITSDGFGGYLSCYNNYFENEDYIEMILSNENMDITIEIDNYKRYKLNPTDKDKTRTRIFFKDIEYIIFPLIMFKNFHVQFNAKENVINFYTNDTSILKPKKKPQKDDSSSDSNGLTIFLVILIIILIIIIGFGIFYFIKKRNKAHHEGDINKFNRFEDDEGQLNSMNEKVF